MKVQKTFQTLSSAACAGVVLLSLLSCDNDNKIINEKFEITSPSDPSSKPQIEEVTYPTAIIGTVSDSGINLKDYFTNIVSPQDARIIIVESGVLNEYDTLLSTAYDKGSLIIVFNPDNKEVAEWSERNNIIYAGTEGDEQSSIYGFNNGGAYYSLIEDGFVGDDDVPLFHLTKWINSISGNRFKGTDLRSKDIKRRFMPQSMTHTFKIHIDEKQLSEGHWGNPEQMSLSTTANVTYEIYPLHAFDGNATGDYYAVEAEMVIHNSSLNNGTWVRHRGDESAQFSGFYLNRCDITASLLRKTNGQIVDATSQRFAEGTQPHPLSTNDAEFYNPGFAWSFDATVSGGIPDEKDNHKLTTHNIWDWNSSAEATLPGIEIKNNAGSNNITYSLFVNSMPDAGNGNIAVTSIPNAATGDITFRYSWIWYVGDMDEDAKDQLYMQVGVNPVYLIYQWLAGGQATIGTFGNAIPENKSVYRFPLISPNRVATCTAMIRNSSPESYYIDNIRLWRNKSTGNDPDFTVSQTICTSNANGGSGVSAVMLVLPAGEYTIEGVRYSIDNDKRINEQVIKNTQPITLSPAGNITIDFGSDLFTVK